MYTTYCSIRNLTFESLVDALTNFSNHTVITISNDVVLPSTVTIYHLENIKIVGQGNPTVNCNHTGALKFISCNNATIEGINWEKCGFNTNYSGIEFHNSFNIFMESCSFYNLTGQAVLLSNVSGNVYINNCSFIHNSQYEGHGAAVYYLPWSENQHINKLVIQTSNFTSNGLAQSIVYIGGCVNGCSDNIYLQDSVFIRNKGVPLYISDNILHINGRVWFEENSAHAGGGIYSNSSIISFNNKSSVEFYRNIVETDGGAFYFINSVVYFAATLIVGFDENAANQNGGAIMSINSNITFDGNSSVTFNFNFADIAGGAAYFSSSYITFDSNSSIAFNDNEAYHGGAVYCVYSSHIIFDGNSRAILNNNKAYYGGALFFESSSHITFHGNSSVTFNNNLAPVPGTGGAVFCLRSSCITFNGSSHVTFNYNLADEDGGAVYCSNSYIIFDGNSSAAFNGNEASRDGGAVNCNGLSDIIFDGNSSVSFNNNVANNDGAAVFNSYSSHITFDGNSINDDILTLMCNMESKKSFFAFVA